MPSFILIHTTVWPQYTNVTDRTDNGLIAKGEPFYKRSPENGSPSAIGPLYVPSVLSVTLVYCGQMVGWIKIKLGMQVGLGPGHIVLDGDPAPP